MKGFVLPRSNAERNAPSYDGQYDPLGDEELLTIEKRGSFLKDTDGKLYYPTKGGFQRVKAFKAYPQSAPLSRTTSDDTAVAVGSGTDIFKVNVMGAYQNSGGARTLSVGNSAKTVVIWTQSIPNATLTMLTINQMDLPKYTYVWWDAAAGASQYVTYVAWDLVSESTV